MSVIRHILKGFWNPVGAVADVTRDPEMGTVGKVATSAFIVGCHQEEDPYPEEGTPMERLQWAIRNRP
jgi:hypothetical protein